MAARKDGQPKQFKPKKCPDCGVEFAPNSGRQERCLPCAAPHNKVRRTERLREWRANNRERYNSWHRSWRARPGNRERENASAREKNRLRYQSDAAYRERRLAHNIRRARSEKAVTYAFLGGGSALYVGSGVESRLYAHKNKPWWPLVETTIVKRQPSTAHARREEYDWIIKWNPVHNIDGYQR